LAGITGSGMSALVVVLDILDLAGIAGSDMSIVGVIFDKDGILELVASRGLGNEDDLGCFVSFVD
jgi:hypothetical protein